MNRMTTINIIFITWLRKKIIIITIRLEYSFTAYYLLFIGTVILSNTTRRVVEVDVKADAKIGKRDDEKRHNVLHDDQKDRLDIVEVLFLRLANFPHLCCCGCARARRRDRIEFLIVVE